MQPVCRASVYGFGIESYRHALMGLQGLLKK
jgi:3-dehydroquinate dehydratase